MEIKQEIAQVQKRPETFADIRKETEARFRELVEAWMQRRSTFQTTLGAMQAFNNVFDRIEAAWERRIEPWVRIARGALLAVNDLEKSPAGNTAALREALKRIVAASIVAKNTNAPEWILQRMADIFAMATTALAAPPRNCDVGTEGEQDERFNYYCLKYIGDSCSRCPLSTRKECVVAWMQMPYEEGGGK